MKALHITHQACATLANGEAAHPGEAAVALNLREREDALEVVGTPEKFAEIPKGHTLLAIHDGRLITKLDHTLFADGMAITTTESNILSAGAMGRFLVVGTSDGYRYLQHTANGYTLLNPADAIPHLHLCATGHTTLSAEIPAYTFNAPLSSWQAPLPSADLSALARLTTNAWNTMERTANDNGLFTQTILARYAVRLWDDSILWMSAPVLIGAAVSKPHYRATTEATISGSQFTGVGKTALQATAYRLDISVTQGVAAEWHDLIKSIDILVTEAVPVVNAASLDYRVGTTNVGTRRYLLELGPSPRTASAVFLALMASKWHVVASTSQIPSLSQRAFVATGVGLSATATLPSTSTYAVHEPLPPSADTPLSAWQPLMAHLSSTVIPHSSLIHGNTLMTGGATLRLRNPWSALPLFDGTISATPCTVTTIISHVTSEGAAEVVTTEQFPFTPSAINPMLACVGTTATRIRIEVTSASGTQVVEQCLSHLYESGISFAHSASLAPLTLSAGNASGAVVTDCDIPDPYLVTISATGNPFAVGQRALVNGGEILALAIASRPIYSGGLGRYPLYAFTSRGIYALPQTTAGTYGTACLMSHKTLAKGFTPKGGDQRIWFLSSLGQLCSISGSRVLTHLHHCDASQMAWNDAEQELWLSTTDWQSSILMTSDRTTRLSLAVAQLFYDGVHALAITPQGEVLNITREVPTQQSVVYRSHPIVHAPFLVKRLRLVAWNVFADRLDLQLRLTGERGASCHGFTICGIHISGVVNSPLMLPVICPPLRTFRIEISGTAPSGTLILPTHLKC